MVIITHVLAKTARFNSVILIKLQPSRADILCYPYSHY